MWVSAPDVCPCLFLINGSSCGYNRAPFSLRGDQVCILGPMKKIDSLQQQITTKNEWGELLTSWLPLQTPQCERCVNVSVCMCMHRQADGVNNR